MLDKREMKVPRKAKDGLMKAGDSMSSNSFTPLGNWVRVRHYRRAYHIPKMIIRAYRLTRPLGMQRIKRNSVLVLGRADAE